MGNIDKIKSTIKGWRLGDYFRQFSIVAAGIIVTFWGSDKVTEHSRQKEVGPRCNWWRKNWSITERNCAI